MNWNEEHLTAFKACFPEPPKQGPVGQPPANYLSILHDKGDVEKWKGKQTRKDIREICQDSNIDVLDAYAAAMAWGGQHRKWFRTSVDQTKALKALLEALRSSKQTRGEDFERTQKACAAITGLGISFYTKLLYFFRPESNAYILDQWTAKSMRLLAGDIVPLANWGGPDPKITPEQYEAFCAKLNQLAVEMGWESGEKAEMAVFDNRYGRWRVWVKNNFAKSGDLVVELEDDVDDDGFIDPLIKSVEQAIEQFVEIDSGVSLPSAEVYSLGVPPNYLAFNLPDRSKICWDIFFQKKAIKCSVRFNSKFQDECRSRIVELYKLENDFGVSFGSKYCLSLSVRRRDFAQDGDLSFEVAKCMSNLCFDVYKKAERSGCLHPNLIPCNFR